MPVDQPWFSIVLAISITLVFGLGVFLFIRSLKIFFERQAEDEEWDEEEIEEFGRQGEEEVFVMLYEIAAECGGRVYENVALRDDEGRSIEIDAIYICTGGFFVIEVKANKGVIFGHGDDKNWYARKEEWQEDKEFYNPVKQNLGHIHHLKKMLGRNAPYMTSLIVFPYADIDSVDNAPVCDLDGASEYILRCIAKGRLSAIDVDRLSSKIDDLIAGHGITHEEHVQRLRERYRE